MTAPTLARERTLDAIERRGAEPGSVPVVVPIEQDDEPIIYPTNHRSMKTHPTTEAVYEDCADCGARFFGAYIYSQMGFREQREVPDGETTIALCKACQIKRTSKPAATRTAPKIRA